MVFSRLYPPKLTCGTRWVSQLNSTSLNGWVRKVLKTGKVTFVHLNDGISPKNVQVVVPKAVASNFHVGSGLKIFGQWVPSKGAQQEFEFRADKVVKMAEEQRMSLVTKAEDLRICPELRITTPEFASLLRVRSKVTDSCHSFFRDNKFYHIDCPLLTLNECEGGGEVFTVNAEGEKDFFGEKNVYLPVSGQLHLEAVTCGLPKVYTLNPAFRAEKSMSSKHLAEFRMLEAEIAFMDDLNELCDFVEKLVKKIVEDCRGLKEEAKLFEDPDADSLLKTCFPSGTFPRISYSECLALLAKLGLPVGQRLSKQQELELVKHFGGPVFVQHFPATQKPFYMRVNDNNEAECFDLLTPIVGELAGGSVREFDETRLRSRCSEPDLDWYFDLRSNGYARSSGFGLGVERLIQSLFGVHNIRDTIPFPRSYHNIKC